MIKKHILIIFILVSSLFVSCNKEASTFNETSHKDEQYDLETDGHVKEIMTELCKSEYGGRVVGTEGNYKASEYIKNFFEELSIKPFKSDDYYSTLNFRVNEEVSGAKNNISAVIKGTNSDKAVFITAHLDHVIGRDGSVLQGAIDNASGISTMLEIAHKLSDITKTKQLSMDVVFVAYNAEETGLNGSYEFVNNSDNRYKEMYNINIDCVGYKAAKNLVMGNGHEISDKLYSSMRQIFDEEKVLYNDEIYATKDGMRYGTSDHEIFRGLGYPALILGDENLLDVVHSSKDNLDNVDFSDLEKISDAVTKFLIKYDGEMFQ